MRIDVEKLISNRQARLEIKTEVPLEDFSFDSRQIKVIASAYINAVLVRDSDSIKATGSFLAKVSTPCDLCGRDAVLDISSDFAESFSAGDPEAYELSGGYIEPERMLTDLIVFSLPAKVSCGADCPGFTDLIEEKDERLNPFYILKQQHESDTEV